VTDGWFIDGDASRNPRGEIVARILPNLSAIKRQEIREFVEDAVHEAVAEARYEWEHEHDPPFEDN
jgi:hypothetical protein